MSTAEPWTIARLLQWTTGFLKERGADTPQLDAQVLLAHALKCEKIMLYARFAETLPEATLAEFRGGVKQRASGMPVAHLIGNREFFPLDFKVTPVGLNPRPRTEFPLRGPTAPPKTLKAAGPQNRLRNRRRTRCCRVRWNSRPRRRIRSRRCRRCRRCDRRRRNRRPRRCPPRPGPPVRCRRATQNRRATDCGTRSRPCLPACWRPASPSCAVPSASISVNSASTLSRFFRRCG